MLVLEEMLRVKAARRNPNLADVAHSGAGRRGSQ
jgi:hypothetical protein